MYVIGFALMMLLNVFCYRNYSTSRTRAVLYTLVTYVYGVTGALIMGSIYSAVSHARGVDETSRVAIFGALVFTPLFLIATAAIEKKLQKIKRSNTEPKKNKNGRKQKTVSIRNTMDLLTPGIFIILTCAKLGCSFDGCCYGVECCWGVHSQYATTTVFPVQLFEFGTMCAIVIICFFLKRTKFFRRGMAFPLTAAVYSVARFGWEFMRYYPSAMQHVFFGLTFWQFFCVIVFVASVISLAVLYKTQQSEPLPRIRKVK